MTEKKLAVRCYNDACDVDIVEGKGARRHFQMIICASCGTQAIARVVSKHDAKVASRSVMRREDVAVTVGTEESQDDE